jgi:hypothetical protein
MKNSYILILIMFVNLSFSQNKRDELTINATILSEIPLKKIINISDLQLTSNQNIILFEIILRDESLNQNFIYHVEGLDSTWIPLENQNKITLTHLLGGKYSLIVKHKNQKEIKKRVNFEVELLIWQHFWFLPSLYFFCFSVLGMIFYLIILYRLRQQLRLQSVRHELEIKALRAQMNPHFIFNCMNTIDAYILRKKFLEASDYLQKFSKLIRKILENSESQTISIEQEIQTLKLYIELEQERFSHSFVSYFDIEPELIANDYQIPSLVLQPFVENAILHGIRHLTERKGMISIILKKMKNESGEDILFCQIQDNGIGRKASSIINEQRQASHKSMGVNVTLERIHTYQAIYGNKMETIVSDLEEGTQVEIKLPLFIGS